MTKHRYDVSEVRRREPAVPRQWKNGADPAQEAEPGSFAARVEAKRVDLVALVKEGIPPRQYHAHSGAMLVKGKRHLVAAPTGEGKSLVFLVHCMRLMLAGERVVVFDRENSADEYARRLEAIADAWQLSKAQSTTIQRNLSYFEFPSLKRTDAAELVHYVRDELAADLVVFDSQRMFLSDIGLRESDTDDYAEWMAWIVDPLYMVGITTLVLDNSGHNDPGRPRGTSSKRDLNEVLFELREVQKFDRNTRGVVKLEVKKSRFGDRGSWRMAIGGGTFGEWQSDDELVLKVSLDKPQFKEVAYEVLRGEERGIGMHKIARAVRARGIKISNSDAQTSLIAWAADPNEPLLHDEKKGYWISE